MAIIKLALPVTGIRGTIAGVVFSENKSGPYVKILTQPTNPTSPKQMTQRGYLAQVGALWRTLSTGEQANWDTFAATPPETDTNGLGETYLLSGFGWFTRIWIRRKRTGQAEDLIAPVSTPTAPPTTFGLTLYPAQGDADRAEFTYTDGEFATYYAILVLSHAPGIGTNVQTSRYLICWEKLGLTATATECGLAYFTAFGETQEGQRYFARLYRQSPEGIRSTPLELFTDVIAYP